MARFSSAFLFQVCDAMFVIVFFDVVEMMAGYTIDLTGLGYVIEIFCKLEYAQSITFNPFFLGGHYHSPF